MKYLSIAIVVIVVACNNSTNDKIIEKKSDTLVGVYNDTIKDSFFKKIYNPRFNTTVIIPQLWILDELPEDGDGFSAFDNSGTGKVEFSGGIAFKEESFEKGIVKTYKSDEWETFCEKYKPCMDRITEFERIYTAFYVKDKNHNVPIRAMMIKYSNAERFFIEKITLTEDHELIIRVSSALKDTSKYKNVFQKILNDIIIENGGINEGD